MSAILRNSKIERKYLEHCLKFCLRGIEYDESKDTPQGLAKAEEGRARAEWHRKRLEDFDLAQSAIVSTAIPSGAEADHDPT